LLLMWGYRTQACAGALHVAGDHQKIGRITREASTAGMMTTSP
jgi:hypothetical protein